MSAPENPPAFSTRHGEGGYGQDGMTLRDYFAGQALHRAAIDESEFPTHGNESSYRGVAFRAYLYADAMLKARAEHSEGKA